MVAPGAGGRRVDDDHARVVARSSLPYDLDARLTAVSRWVDLLEVSIDGPLGGRAAYQLDRCRHVTRQ